MKISLRRAPRIELSIADSSLCSELRSIEEISSTLQQIVPKFSSKLVEGVAVPIKADSERFSPSPLSFRAKLEIKESPRYSRRGRRAEEKAGSELFWIVNDDLEISVSRAFSFGSFSAAGAIRDAQRLRMFEDARFMRAKPQSDASERRQIRKHGGRAEIRLRMNTGVSTERRQANLEWVA